MATIWGFDGTEKLQLFKVVMSDERADYIFAKYLGNNREFPFMSIHRYMEEKRFQYEGDLDDEWYANAIYTLELYSAPNKDGKSVWHVIIERDEGDIETMREWYQGEGIDPERILLEGKYKISDNGIGNNLRDSHVAGPLGHGRTEDEGMKLIFLNEMQDAETGELLVLLKANEFREGGKFPQWYDHPHQKKYVPLYITTDNGQALPRSSLTAPGTDATL